MSIATRQAGNVWTPKTDQSEVLYLPFWRPDLGGSPASIKSKDRNAHTATITGTTWGYQGRTFNGSGDVILMPIGILSAYSEGTVGMWVSPAASDDLFGYIRNGANYIDIVVGANREIRIYAAVGAVVQFDGSTPNSVVPASEFTHVAWTKTGTTHVIYINGVSQTITWANTTDQSVYFDDYPVGTPNPYPYIGNSYLAGWLTGTCGELRVFSRALALSEVLCHYQATKWRYGK